jgi:hypothetical protein
MGVRCLTSPRMTVDHDEASYEYTIVLWFLLRLVDVVGAGTRIGRKASMWGKQRLM